MRPQPGSVDPSAIQRFQVCQQHPALRLIRSLADQINQDTRSICTLIMVEEVIFMQRLAMLTGKAMLQH